MSPPPTSIDGTDITGATIDGQEVQEITIDGQTVFTAVPVSGLLRYPFENENNDTSVAEDVFGDNDGTVTGATHNASGGQDGGGYYEFTGKDSDDKIRTSNADAEFDFGTSGDFSFTLWVDFDDPTEGALFEVYDSDSNHYRVFNSDDGSGQWAWSVDGPKLHTFAHNFDQPGWNHYAFVRRSGVFRLYHDGTEVDSFTDSSDCDVGGNLDWGYDEKGGTAWGLNGGLDDARVYDKGLSDTEVSNLFNTDEI